MSIKHLVIPERKAYMKAYMKEYAKSPEQRQKRREYQKTLTDDKQLEYRLKSATKNPITRLLTVARIRAKNRNIEFDLVKDDVIWNEYCPILNLRLEFNFGKGNGGKPNSPSLDRIDNSKGYVKGNVQVISHLANSMKSTATKEQLLQFADWVGKFYV